jgi:hypothetical protein
MRFRSAIASLALASVLIGAAQPVRLKPTSKWVIDHPENSCRLSRSFGDGKDRTVVVFEAVGPDEMDMLVVGKPLDSWRVGVPAKFLPVQSKGFIGKPATSARNGDPALLWSHVPMLSDATVERLRRRDAAKHPQPGVRPPPANLIEQATLHVEREQFAGAANALEIEVRREKPLVLDTGSLAEPVKSFDQCIRESLRAWGADPDLEDKITRRPWPIDRAHWLTADDYPERMVSTHNEAEVSFRLLVDATGKVTKCTSLSHFRHKEFDEVVCVKLTQRARFAPAELADGTKVPSYYINRVVFELDR